MDYVFSAEKVLSESSALVVGAGGLGGWVIEYLARAGIKKITAVDGDVFSSSNLNRQLYSTSGNLGEYKVFEAKKRIFEINPKVEFVAVSDMLGEKNASGLVSDADIVFDCCDNQVTRLLLEKVCSASKKILIHGAINRTFGQVSAVFPGDGTLSRLYSGRAEKTEKTLAYVPAVIAGLQVNEGIKALVGGENTLGGGKVLFVDFINNSYDFFSV